MRRFVIISQLVIFVALTMLSSVSAEQKGKPVYGHTDPSQYKESKNAHDGAGSIHYMELLGSDLFETDFLFIHRGVLPPKSGIGEHQHNEMEEMYFVFNAPAEFTVNGETALLPAGSCVLCPLGSSHGIYNNSDETLEWLNIAVSKEKGKYDVVNLDKDLTKQTLESPAPFEWGHFDRSLLKPVGPAHDGKGKILNRRPWIDGNFGTNWVRIGHCILPPGTSIGYHQHNTTEEVYYVMSGKGRMTVNDHTWEVGKGDAVPCTLKDSHGLYNHTDEDLDIFVLIVAMEQGVFGVKNWGDDLSDR
ncbi:cupin domain-containing protein [Candidatus Latescibacterota bacterium]